MAGPGLSVLTPVKSVPFEALISWEPATVSLKPNSPAIGEVVVVGVMVAFQIQLPAAFKPPLLTVRFGTANTGEATTHNKPADTKLFQDIRISPPS
jgi:hypothetical protein